jgi:hypothetical protein
MTVLDQSFAAREHRGAYDADHLEHRTAHERVAVLGKSQGLGIFFTDFVRHGGDQKTLMGLARSQLDCRAIPLGDLIRLSQHFCQQRCKAELSMTISMSWVNRGSP